MRQVNGKTVQLTVPDAWGEQHDGDTFVVAAPSRPGFQANIVVAETRCDAPVALATQASQRALMRDVPGAWIVDAQLDRGEQGVERHRFVALIPLAVAGDTHTVVAIQDCVVVDGVGVQLTATVPLSWGDDAWETMIAVLDSLRLLPESGRQLPEAASQIADELDVDHVASARAGVDVESLAWLHGGGGWPAGVGQHYRITPAAFAELERLAAGGRLFRPTIDLESAEAHELQRLGFLDHSGQLTTTGRGLRGFLRQGSPWTFTAMSADRDEELRGWTAGRQSLIVGPVPGAGVDEPLLATACEVEEIVRICLSWCDCSTDWCLDATPERLAADDFFGCVMGDEEARRHAAPDSPLQRPGLTYLTFHGARGAFSWLWIDGVGVTRVRRVGNEIEAFPASARPLWMDFTGFVIGQIRND